MTKEQIVSTVLANDQIALFYLGQESILVKTSKKYILFDPYLSDYVDKHCCSENVKWVRRYDAPIAPSELDFVDYVLCSHSHYDHTDPETLTAMAKVNPKACYIAPVPFKDQLLSYGIGADRIIGAEAYKAITLDGITVMPLPAAHEELVQDKHGRYDCLCYKVTADATDLFHAGDCCIYDGLAQSLGKIDVAMLPVNGRSYYKRYVQDIIGNMTASEAAELATIVGAKLMIPMHFDLYDVNCVTTATVVDGIESTSKTLPYHIFKPGERYIFAK